MSLGFLNYRLIDEILEFMWIKLIDEKKSNLPISRIINDFSDFTNDFDMIFNALQDMEYIIIKDKNVNFAPKGRDRAIHIIRSHRLAERLMTDVLKLETDENLVKTACSFEHAIDDSVEEAICTLLGHPKVCPHGLAIPPGPCCKRDDKEIEPIIKPLNELSIGESGIVLYFTSEKNKEMHKLMSIGIIPGVKLRIHQKMSFDGPIVIQIDQTQYALDPSIAKNIFIRTENNNSNKFNIISKDKKRRRKFNRQKKHRKRNLKQN